ncbi:Nuclear pore complex, rNup107 component (sc Nup84) [Ceraceosorus bombacis]|uniref:Nuclear pore complex protein n=1 Tax=Ceraceosorus bombacis TaxID=401625 RepID=A0A0P1BM56_9BASI|nr:Nuclear pore complex, rNup107 component (sc Nup84) [Ceraceosorus bombacis]
MYDRVRQDFADALLGSRESDRSQLLDLKTGLAAWFSASCQGRADSARAEQEVRGGVGLLGRDEGAHEGQEVGGATGGEALDQEDIDAWNREARTWQLIARLYHDRLSRQPAAELQASQGSSSHPYETPLSSVQRLLAQSPGLAELELVRTWLSEYLGESVSVVEVRKGYRPYTRNKIRSEKRTGSNKPASRLNKEKIEILRTQSLDPDAPQEVREDATYEKALTRALFEYVRAGRLLEALDLTRQADQPWRAASLRGAILHWRPGCGNDEEALDEPEEATGNRNRLLWKAVCRTLASKSGIEEHERALYGALSGDLQSVLAVSSSWEAHLWAYVNARLEAAVDKGLNARAGWWSQDATDTFPEACGQVGAVKLNELVVPDALAIIRRANTTETMGSADKGEINRELKQIFEVLAQTESHGVHEQANNPYAVVQRAVILDNVNEFLMHVEQRLLDMRETADPRIYARLVRFFAHLVLFLRRLQVDKPPSDMVANSILRAYVEVLEVDGAKDSLVAMYASALEPESATQSYAHFLKLMPITATEEERRAALARASENDLDVAAVARMTVAMIFDELIPMMPSGLDPEQPLLPLEAPLSEEEICLIRAIDWLTYDESTSEDVILQSNLLLRLFLVSGKVNAARQVLEHVPEHALFVLDDAQVAEDEKTEHLHWKTFFEAYEAHVRFSEVWNKRTTTMGSDHARQTSRHAFVHALYEIVEMAQEKMEEVLQMDWLKIQVVLVDVQAERRALELTRIRKIYIPELIFRLHFMLLDSSEFIPGNLAIALNLPNLVADEKHKLYLDFISMHGNSLKQYLAFVRQAHLESFDRLGTDSFKAAASAPTLSGAS